jgi:hypothetical protein
MHFAVAAPLALGLRLRPVTSQPGRSGFRTAGRAASRKASFPEATSAFVPAEMFDNYARLGDLTTLTRH